MKEPNIQALSEGYKVYLQVIFIIYTRPSQGEVIVGKHCMVHFWNVLMYAIKFLRGYVDGWMDGPLNVVTYQN